MFCMLVNKAEAKRIVKHSLRCDHSDDIIVSKATTTSFPAIKERKLCTFQFSFRFCNELYLLLLLPVNIQWNLFSLLIESNRIFLCQHLTDDNLILM